MSEQNQTVISRERPISSEEAFWIEQGKKMFLPHNLDNLANSLFTLLGVILGFIQGIYLAIIGFAKIIPKDLAFIQILFFMSPVIFWLLALNSCMKVYLIPEITLKLMAPKEIIDAYGTILRKKQTNLRLAFIYLAFGIILSVVVILFFSK